MKLELVHLISRLGPCAIEQTAPVSLPSSPAFPNDIELIEGYIEIKHHFTMPLVLISDNCLSGCQ